MSMPETTRFTVGTGSIELGFVDRVFTPKWAIKLAIKVHLRGLSLANTVSILDKFGVYRCRSTVHNWVQKADLEPRAGRDPTKIALDETAVKVNGERFWLFAAVDPDTNRFLHMGLYSIKKAVATKLFLQEFREIHAIDDAEFSSMVSRGCRLDCLSSACAFSRNLTVIEILSNLHFRK